MIDIIPVNDAQTFTYEFKDIMTEMKDVNTGEEQNWNGDHHTVHEHGWHANIERNVNSNKFSFYLYHCQGSLPVTVYYSMYLLYYDSNTGIFNESRGVKIATYNNTWIEHNGYGTQECIDLQSAVAAGLYNAKKDSMIIKYVLHKPE
jgi:hypothetical protein